MPKLTADLGAGITRRHYLVAPNSGFTVVKWRIQSPVLFSASFNDPLRHPDRPIADQFGRGDTLELATWCGNALPGDRRIFALLPSARLGADVAVGDDDLSGL